MGKYKYLLKNMGIMTISNFSSKILSFLMVPLYTSVLTTSEYGTYDFYVTTILLLTPLLSFNILDAVIRYCLDDDSDHEKIFTIGVKFCFRAIIICGCFVLVNECFSIITLFNQYPLYFFLYFSLSLTFDLLNQFARGIERLFDVAVGEIINTVTLISLNIVLLLFVKIGIAGYFIAYCAAFGLADTYLLLRLKAWRYFKWQHLKKSKLEKTMKTYSAPMILQNMGAWINNLSDRYVVTWLCGSTANGIYSISYKIPAMLTIFQTIFNQAWTISAVKTQNDEAEEFYSKIYSLYNMGFVLCCTLLIGADKVIARILFSKDFYLAWMYSPFLLISVVFNSIAGLLGGILIAQKKTNIIASTSIIGAVVNVVLNLILVKFVGPIGAAISTMVSYFIVWGKRLVKTRKSSKLHLKLKRDIFSYIILLLQALALLVFKENMMIYSVQMIFVGINILLYGSEIKDLFRQVMKRNRNNEEVKR